MIDLRHPYESTNPNTDGELFAGTDPEKALLLRNFITYVWDNIPDSQWTATEYGGVLNNGPLDFSIHFLGKPKNRVRRFAICRDDSVAIFDVGLDDQQIYYWVSQIHLYEISRDDEALMRITIPQTTSITYYA